MNVSQLDSDVEELNRLHQTLLLIDICGSAASNLILSVCNVVQRESDSVGLYVSGVLQVLIEQLEPDRF